jgi:hypothetical protein
VCCVVCCVLCAVCCVLCAVCCVLCAVCRVSGVVCCVLCCVLVCSGVSAALFSRVCVRVCVWFSDGYSWWHVYCVLYEMYHQVTTMAKNLEHSICPCSSMVIAKEPSIRKMTRRYVSAYVSGMFRCATNAAADFPRKRPPRPRQTTATTATEVDTKKHKM